MKQLKLFAEKTITEFGGSLLKKGKRKTKRPLDLNKSLHLVLKASDSYKLLRNKTTVEQVISKYSEKLDVKVYSMATNADHVHLNVKFKSRVQYVAWVRAITSVLVQRVAGLKWKLRPYTRILSWGKQFTLVQKYILGNQKEGELVQHAISVTDFYDSYVEKIKSEWKVPNRIWIEVICQT